MELRITSFQDGDRIPDEHCFCNPAAEGHVQMGANQSPHVQWSDLPKGTRSLVLLCHDPDVPSKPDDVNQEGRTVPKDLPRTDFYHWVLIDIDPGAGELPAGQDADGITPHGKETGRQPYGVRGKNDYTSWFEGDDEMEGTYGGYDGPCPPWNDERLHHYHFTLYALDTDTLGLSGDFGGAEAREAMKGHVLDQTRVTGTYSLYSELIED